MSRVVYFVTFTTFATLVAGDRRIATRRRRRGARHALRIPPNPRLRAAILRRAREPPFRMGLSQRLAVRRSITETCVISGWGLAALTVERSHVHAVIACSLEGERLLRTLKSRATTALWRAGLAEGRSKIWTCRGSARRLSTMTAITRVVAYINRHAHANE